MVRFGCTAVNGLHRAHATAQARAAGSSSSRSSTRWTGCQNET